MKKNYIIRIMVAGIICAWTLATNAQEIAFTRQVITVNSGKFEFSPPYTDYVTIMPYNPETQLSGISGSILTQSAQDIIINGHFAYVAAQDSLIKYDINTWNRVAAIADSGLAKLCLYKDKLLVSKQYPVAAYFMEVLDTSDLSLVARTGNIPGDCGSITTVNDSVYIAVNGGWMGTEGKLAVISPSSWNLVHIYNFGSQAVGIFNLYQYSGKIFSINKTPFGAPKTGSITEFNPSNGTFVNHMLPVSVGNAAGIKGSLLYLRMNNGLGSYDLDTKELADSAIIADPGSLQSLNILSAAVDSLANRLYVNIGDYFSPGICLVTNLSGDSITSYSTGISTECIAMDYRHHPAGIEETTGISSMSVYPNPATDRITFQTNGMLNDIRLTIISSSGQEVMSRQFTSVYDGNITLAIGLLHPGIYMIKLVSGNNCYAARFVKQ